MKSVLIKDQKKRIHFNNRKLDGQRVDLILTLRYDDECGNGHNSFSITADIYETGKRSDRALIMCGCCHDEIKKIAPEYAKYIKWHLVSSDEPLAYIENTIYYVTKIEKYNNFVYLIDKDFSIKSLLGMFSDEETEKLKSKYKNLEINREPDRLNKDINLESARRTAIAPNATLEQLQSKEWLKARLPKLMEEFKTAMEEIGFKY